MWRALLRPHGALAVVVGRQLLDAMGRRSRASCVCQKAQRPPARGAAAADAQLRPVTALLLQSHRRRTEQRLYVALCRVDTGGVTLISGARRAHVVTCVFFERGAELAAAEVSRCVQL